MTEPLEFDGERFTPESVREIWYEHMHRYVFAAQFVSGLNVLDAACGEGYGSAMLARHAQSVQGVDVSSRAIEHARKRYSQENLQFNESDCTALPFEDDQFDCIVSFETIEHLERQEEMLAEFRRVLKPSGFLVISSPDKSVYSDEQGFDNPHHVRELYPEEFQALLDQQFPVTRMLGQKLMFHSAIWPLESSEGRGMPSAVLHSHEGSESRAVDRPVQKAMYLLALCAENESSLPQVNDSLWLFDDEQESVYQHYQEEIRKHIAAGHLLAERDADIEKLREALESAQSESSKPPSLLQRLGIIKRR